MVTKVVTSQQTTTLLFVAGFTTIISVLGTYLYQKLKSPKIPTIWKPVGKVQTICVYPTKSGRRIEVQQAECTKEGLMETEKFDKSLRLRDRSFVVYQESTLEYRTARHHSKMLLIETKAKDLDSVVLDAPDMSSLVLKVPKKGEGKVVIVKHHKKEPIPAIDLGDEASIWISQYVLGENSGLRIGYHQGNYKRKYLNVIYKELNDYFKRGFSHESAGLNSDISAVMMISQASVNDINSKLGDTNISVHNFRPNLVVDDPKLLAFDEDNWEWIKVGDVVMKNVMECLRCFLITVDNETAIRRSDGEPLKTLKSFRTSESPHKYGRMGVLLEVFKTGKISVGDTIYVGKLG